MLHGVPRPVVVKRVERVSETYYWLELGLVGWRLEAGPGQFILIWLPRLKEVAMSIAMLGDSSLSVFFKVVGSGTRRLAVLEPGARLGVKAPLGRSFTGMVRGGRVLLVAGGTGLAPMIFASRKLAELGKQVTLVWGTPSSTDAVKVHKFLETLLPQSVGFHVATDDCGYGFCGTAVDLAYKLALQDGFDDVAAAGPKPMLASLVEKMGGMGFDPIVLLEERVRCGLGLCGSCSIPGTPFLLCVEGPAFRYSSVVSYFGMARDRV